VEAIEKCEVMATENRIRKIALVFSAVLFLTATSGASGSFPNDLGSTQYDLLKRELNRFYEIRQQGGWEKITLAKKYYMRGEKAPVVSQIKERLKATGQFTSSDNSTLYTDELAEAVKKAQKQFGLTQTGSVDAPLVKELNVPVEKRIAQLEVNMERTRNSRFSGSGTTLIANIPEFRLHVYEDGKEVFDMAIVVGKSSTKTEVFNDQMTHLVFSPYWNVPPSIASEEIFPAARRDRNYLRNNGYEVINGEVRQRPGAQNSLGRVKFVFPNSHNIYFHDTPAKSLFKMDARAFSHGCIRLSEPAKLAEYLLRKDPSWTAEKIKQAMESGREQTVRLSSPAQVAITYFTAWVDDEGGLNFRNDIYGRDGHSSKQMTGVAKL
jgi:murein L,D-transpeptidase YcbB/YkuD